MSPFFDGISVMLDQSAVGAFVWCNRVLRGACFGSHETGDLFLFAFNPDDEIIEDGIFVIADIEKSFFHFRTALWTLF